MKTALASSSSLLTVLVWVAALVVDPGPFEETSVLLIGLGALFLATVATVGMIVTGGRWAHRTALALTALCAGLAVVRPLDAYWVVGLVMLVAAGTVLMLPVVTEGIRKLPSAVGPPPRSVGAALLLLAAPLLLGLVSWSDATPLTVTIALFGPIAAVWFTRVIPLGLAAVRILFPIAAIAAAAWQPAPAAAVSLALGLGVAALAWHPSVKVSFHPPEQRGTVFPIPPELAPPDVLEATREQKDRG